MIKSLNELVYFLEQNYNNESICNFSNIIKYYIGNDWKKYADFTKPFSKNMIYNSDNFEIVLISWQKDYSTEYHNHPKNGCILFVLEGYLMEQLKNNNEETVSIYKKNDISYMHDIKGIHKITALENTFSVHIYSPPGFYNK